MYKRKTRDVYMVMVDYGYGFEAVDRNYDIRCAKENLRLYRENEPYPAMIKKFREQIKEEEYEV